MPKKVVAIGGGTGLPIVLKAWRDLPAEITAIVTMADDGGSSGRLRQELGILPPGDVRNCLIALAEEPDSELAALLAYRFPTGWSLAEHNLGNLMLAALSDYKGGFAEAVAVMSEMLNVRGDVLPSTLDTVTLVADLGTGSMLAGQALIARTELISKVHLEPKDAAVYPPAVNAIKVADIILIGPGSLFTSIIPNLLVPGIAKAIRQSQARKILVLNTVNMREETRGMTAVDYVVAVINHAGQGIIDTVLADGAEDCLKTRSGAAEPLAIDKTALEQSGLAVEARNLADASDPVKHDLDKLRAYFISLL